ncbi:gamma-aminobutyric acid receptor subunit alpha-6 [Lepeophtheirus salmonis]|uniref:gamma-aminobutyric acid receptor subunit alpha-6 n=1 Tax=Lepeophtheirus salmonis TaxID=72036 RepID=UPI001AEA590D|nr:gamma-aminobutyric acid receptor subunit alpha-6-like [Lepeophtheirus salmonis]
MPTRFITALVLLIHLRTFFHASPLCQQDENEEMCLSMEEEKERDDRLVSRYKRAFTAYKTGQEQTQKVSETLDHLLVYSFYDKRIRPKLGGPPVKVVINLSILSMGPVDEARNAFSMDCYFRQSWVDERLKYNTSGVEGLALNWAFLAKIWVPDTFIINGKKSFLHKITVPNRFVRVSPTGKVSYSQRLTILANCIMNLKKFPFDTQICPLKLGSFGHSNKDLIYQWKKPKAVSFNKLGLAQFHLINYSSYNIIEPSLRLTEKGNYRNDSSSVMEFVFERQSGYFLLQIYTPLTLIVFCSWVAFWLVKTEKGGEVPARTVLGANSVLSIVNIGFTGKDRPKVGYATALDVFIILCFITVFAALVEFACINFIDTFIKWKRIKIEEQKESDGGREEAKPNITMVSGDDVQVIVIVDKEEDDDLIYVDEDESSDEEEEEEDNFLDRFLHFFGRCQHSIFERTERYISKLSHKPLIESRIYTETFDYIQEIDGYCRKGFPLCFLLLQILYWVLYLYVIE